MTTLLAIIFMFVLYKLAKIIGFKGVDLIKYVRSGGRDW